MAAPEIAPKRIQPEEPAPQVEVAHEALIQNWDLLRIWLNEERVWLQLREEIGEAADDWLKNDRDTSYLLHRGERLTEVEALASESRLSLNANESAYLAACIAERRREADEARRVQERELAAAQELAASRARANRRLTWFSVVLVILLISSGLASWNAIVNREKAQTQAGINRISSLVAQSNLAANAGNDELAVLLAVEASNRNGDQMNMAGPIGSALEASAGAPYFSTLLDDHRQLLANALAYQAQGRFIAASHGESSVTLWDLSVSPLIPRTLDEPDSGILAVAFSRDGVLLAAASAKKTIDIWNVSGGAPRYIGKVGGGATITDAPAGGIYSIAFGESGAGQPFLFVAGCDDEACDSGGLVLQRWDIDLAANTVTSNAPVVIKSPSAFSYARMYSIAISPDSQWIAIGGCAVFSSSPAAETTDANGCREGLLAIRRIDDLSLGILDPDPGKGAVNAVAFGQYADANGDARMRLAYGGDDRLIHLCDFSENVWSCDTTNALAGHNEEVRALSFSPDGAFLVSGGHDGNVLLWHFGGSTAVMAPPYTQTAPVQEQLGTTSEWVRGVAFNGAGDRMISTDEDGQIALWTMRPSQPLTAPDLLRGHTSYVRALAFSPNAAQPLLASVAEDGTVRLWSIDQEHLVTQTINFDSPKVSSLSFSGDGTRLAVGVEDGTVWVLDPKAPEETLKNVGNHNAGPLMVAVSPDGMVVAAAGSSGGVQLWDANAAVPTKLGEIEPVVTADGATTASAAQVWGLVFSEDGSTLAAGDSSGVIRIWSYDAGSKRLERRAVLSAGVSAVRSLAVSSDGELASGDADGIVCYWGDDLSEDRNSCPDPLEGHASDVRSLAFDPSGAYLASGGKDQSLRIWFVHHLDDEPMVIPSVMEWVRAVAFSADGSMLAVVTTQGGIRPIPTPNGDLLRHACAQVQRMMTTREWQLAGLSGRPADSCSVALTKPDNDSEESVSRPAIAQSVAFIAPNSRMRRRRSVPHRLRQIAL